MGQIDLGAFIRDHDPYIIDLDHSTVNLNELWRAAIDPESIEDAARKAETATYSAIIDLVKWVERQHGKEYLSDQTDEYHSELASRYRLVFAGISLLEYLTRFRAIHVLPPEVAELHIAMPNTCENCGAEIPAICAECEQEWPCETVRIPVDYLMDRE